MRFEELAIRGVWLIDADLVEDARGVFRRSFCAGEFASRGLTETMIQGNISENPTAGTLRGLHFQVRPFEEAKTLTCLTGALYDIVVDLRPDSSTFLQWIGVHISAVDRRSLHVPIGCANGWLTTFPMTTIHYYMSERYDPGSSRGIRYNDPAFQFAWPSEPALISERDRGFQDFDSEALRSSVRGAS